MASSKKVQIFVEETGTQLTSFATKTLTKLFKKDELQGHVVDILIQEPGHSKGFVGKYPIQGDGGGGGPPEDKPPVVDAGDDAIVKEGSTVTLDASAHDDGKIVRQGWTGPDGLAITPDPQDPTNATFTAPMIPEGQSVIGLILFYEAEDDKANITRDSCIITVTKDGQEPPKCPPGQHMENGHCVPDQQPSGDVLYDSLTDSKLHDGIVRTVKQEGSITPNGKGVECRASGNPRIVVNADGTFSLVCDGGHGRFYLYVCNYNVIFELTVAIMQQGSDCSTKGRSQHNEGGACEHRFGGYGFAFDLSSWDAKREVCHNIHDEAKSGSLSVNTTKFVTLRFTIKDEGTTVKQLAEIDGKQVMDKTDDAPKPYMIDKASYDAVSYLWVRQNRTSGTGELRIKRMRVLKA